MNPAAIVRRLEQGGFTHELKREIALVENPITSKFDTLIMWLAGIAILQTATIIVGTAGLTRLLS